MSKQYNQFRAMLAITRASLIGILRSPSTVIFSIFFPLIFILVFGFIGSGGLAHYRVVLQPGSDTANAVVDSLKAKSNIRFVQYERAEEQEADVIRGRITGVLDVRKLPSGGPADYVVQFHTTTASADQFATFLPLLENVVNRIDRVRYREQRTYAQVVPDIRTVRQYRTIDFILPGQLGFSLLSSGVFGVAFLFFSLRQQLVLKRFYATPIRRGFIVLGEGLSRVAFLLVTAVIIIGIGHYAFEFTLINGWITFLEILVLSFLALLVFMGFGFIVSSVAQNESSIPPFANLITLPQFLLAGTFFSIEVFPGWLQPISRAMPLTYFNDAMRRISFEGAHLTDCGKEIGIILLWGLAAYAVAIKVFKWE